MKRTLVIIDMQSGFHTANAHRTISNVIKQVKRAKKFKENILVVEYLPHVNYEATRPEIMRSIGSYPHIKVYKYRDDGSQPILEACKYHSYPTDIFRVCGVNTNACILDTLKGLFRRNKTSKLEVVPAACNGHYGNDIFDKFTIKYKVTCIGRTPSKDPVRYI